MKTFFTYALFIGSVAMACATVQYDINGHTIKMREDTPVFVSIYENTTTNVSQFGYYFKKSADGQDSSWHFMDLNSLDAVELGELAKNDQVAFFAVLENGTVVDKFHIQSYDEPNGLFSLETSGSGSIGNLDGKLILSINSKAPAAPAGQPLPGILASAAVGAMALAGWRIKRKK